MSIQSEINRINNNVQATLNTIADTGVSVGTNSDALPMAAAALANEKLNRVIGRTESGKIMFVDDTGTVSYLTPGNGVTITDRVITAHGEKGETGDSGVYVGTTAPEDESVNVWIDPDGAGMVVSEAKSLTVAEVRAICT